MVEALETQERFPVRGHDDGEVASHIVVESAISISEQQRIENQAKRFAAQIFPWTVLGLRRNDE
jgi:hypothetical protein